MQTFSVDVDDALQTASRRVLSSLRLDGTDHENLADGAALLAAVVGFVLTAETYVGLVDLDDAAQWTSVRTNHRPTELVEQKPGGLAHLTHSAFANVSLARRIHEQRRWINMSANRHSARRSLWDKPRGSGITKELSPCYYVIPTMPFFLVYIVLAAL